MAQTSLTYLSMHFACFWEGNSVKQPKAQMKVATIYSNESGFITEHIIFLTNFYRHFFHLFMQMLCSYSFWLVMKLLNLLFVLSKSKTNSTVCIFWLFVFAWQLCVFCVLSKSQRQAMKQQNHKQLLEYSH